MQRPFCNWPQVLFQTHGVPMIPFLTLTWTVTALGDIAVLLSTDHPAIGVAINGFCGWFPNHCLV